jgi:hypothetical protein
MVALISRRLALPAFAALIGYSERDNTRLPLQNAVDLICDSTPVSFRQAALQASESFLYRGEDEHLFGAQTAAILHPTPDLLVEGTYSDPEALQYFQRLEEKLPCECRVRPSTGHIGTSNPNEAARWGLPVSVWPLGTSIEYVWPSSSSVLFPVANNNEKLVINQGLVMALRTHDREVLFTSWFDSSTRSDSTISTISKHVVSSEWISAFVVVPSKHDDELRRLLRERNYGIINKNP